MELNADALAFGKMQIAAAAAIFLSTLLWALVFGLTGIAANDFFTFKLHIVLNKLLSANLALFLLTFPLTIALMAVFAKRMEKANLILVSMISTLFALIAAMAVFPTLQSLWLIAVFYIISVPLLIETAFVKYLELKKWVTMRTMMSATGKAITLISLGLVVLSVSTILPQQQEYIGRFEGFILDFAEGFASGKSQQTLTTGAADVIVESQIATVDSFLLNPAYNKLREKTDLDVIAFVALADSAKEYIKGPEYRQQIEQQLREASSSVIQEMNVMEVIKQQFPFFKMLEQLLWVMHALSLVAVFSLLANIVCKPAAVVYGLVAEKMLSLFAKQPAKQEK